MSMIRKMSENTNIRNNPSETTTKPDVIKETESKSSETLIETNNESQSDCSKILSKRKQKKILKMAKWEETKKIKRQQEKEKRKEKRIKEVELGIIGSSSKRKKLKANKLENSVNLVRVAIDFDYDELMLDKDIAKCSKQLLWVYTVNRKSTMPIRLHITSVRDDSRIKNAIKRHDGYQNWDVKLHAEPYHELFNHKDIVYLTSDSDNVLNEVDQNAVYIIGGLVDHNHHKGLSLQRAEEKGFKTARLPISEHIDMKTRSVLTIVHVFQILLKVSEGKPWKETLLEVLPQRKFKPSRKRKHKHNSTNKIDEGMSADIEHEINEPNIVEENTENSSSQK